MQNRAVGWHRQRMRTMLSSSRFSDLSRPKLGTYASLMIVPFLHFYLCFVSTRLEIWQLIALAYFVGSVVFMYLFSNAHEVHHATLGKRLGGKMFRNIFLRFTTMTDLTSALYLYYRYHEYHHSDQGTHRLRHLNQKYLTPSLDMDPLTNFKNIYKFKIGKSAKAAYRFPKVESNRIWRFFSIFVMPFFDTIYELMIEPIKLFKWFGFKDAPFSRRAIEGAFIQGILIVSTVVAMGVIFESWQHLLYIFLCRVFFLGFLHPYALMWSTIHSSVNEGQHYQPTSSLYGSLTTFFCAGINLHTEHHDVPWVPRSRLPDVRANFPELYQGIQKFDGLADGCRHIFQKNYQNTYAP